MNGKQASFVNVMAPRCPHPSSVEISGGVAWASLYSAGGWSEAANELVSSRSCLAHLSAGEVSLVAVSLSSRLTQSSSPVAQLAESAAVMSARTGG